MYMYMYMYICIKPIYMYGKDANHSSSVDC